MYCMTDSNPSSSATVDDVRCDRRHTRTARIVGTTKADADELGVDPSAEMQTSLSQALKRCLRIIWGRKRTKECTFSSRPVMVVTIVRVNSMQKGGNRSPLLDLEESTFNCNSPPKAPNPELERFLVVVFNKCLGCALHDADVHRSIPLPCRH